ncbi:MAG: DNA polymerase IV [Anaerolineae bacterium]
MPARWIIHLDLDAFFASVEELLRPELAGLPIIVGGPPEARGVVASASYAARRWGVRSAMPTAQALRLCPHAVLVPPRHGVYGEFSDRVMAVLHEYTPLVEQISIDEAFMDVTGCERRWGEPLELAAGIQRRIQEEIGLSASLGIAGSKLVAKIASDYGKPHGLVLVSHGEEAAFLAPLDIERLWGVGRVTARKLRAAGVRTIGDLARLSREQVESWLVNFGVDLWLYAQGIDSRPVVPDAGDPQSVSHGETFAQDISDPTLLDAELLRLSEKVGARLRRYGLQGRTVFIKLRYSDFTTITRQETLAEPTDIDMEIYRHARRLWEKAWERGRPVRLIGVGLGQLSTTSWQLSLLPADSDELVRQRQRALNQAVDAIRQRFGDKALRRARLLRRPRG